MAVSHPHQYEYPVSEKDRKHFIDNGFVVLNDVISKREIQRYVTILNDMLSGKISTKNKRGDLGGHVDRVNEKLENTVQIIHPYFSVFAVLYVF